MDFLSIEDEIMRKSSMYTIAVTKMFDCHINVEYCSSEMAVKYINKYIHKGHDHEITEMKQHETDEVQKYIDSDYV